VERKKQVIFVVANYKFNSSPAQMKNLYAQVHQSLIGTYGTAPQGKVLKQINNLCGMITGMIRKGSCHMPDIGSGLPQNIDAKSQETAATRFVDNKWVDYETYFLPYVSQFLRAVFAVMACTSNVLLVIDGSQMGKHHAALMICLVWRGRGIPLCWFVKKGAKGHFTEDDHINLVRRAQQIIQPLRAPAMSITLLGDGEFDGIDLQKCCLEENWNYVLRTACDSILIEEGERFKPKNITPAPKEQFFFIPHLEFTAKRFKYVNFVCWHDRKKHQDPIYLISNLNEACEIIECYAERFSIERLFSNPLAKYTYPAFLLPFSKVMGFH
jgi:hypothetical protein